MSNRTAATGQTLPSTHQPQLGTGVVATIKATSAGNTCVVYGDKAVWDPTASKFVLVDQTTVGTTLLPKL